MTKSIKPCRDCKYCSPASYAQAGSVEAYDYARCLHPLALKTRHEGSSNYHLGSELPPNSANPKDHMFCDFMRYDGWEYCGGAIPRLFEPVSEEKTND